MHYPLEILLTSVRWCAPYPLSLRHIEVMMQERGMFVDHVTPPDATVHRWVDILPVLAAVCRNRKRFVGASWRMDETAWFSFSYFPGNTDEREWTAQAGGLEPLGSHREGLERAR